MNATELFLKDGTSAGVFYCGKCKHVAQMKATAEQCCTNSKCCRCGGDTGHRFVTLCDMCVDVKRLEEEQARFEAAEKLMQWDGWIYDGSEYFESIADMMDVKTDDELPEYVWACEADHFVNASVSDIISRMEDMAYEDWEPDTLNGLDELKSALDKFNDANKDVCSYRPDYTKAVLLKAHIK